MVLTKNNAHLRSLKIIKLKAVKLLTCMLFMPEWQAKQENFFTDTDVNFTKCIGSHFGRIFKQLNNHKSIDCIQINLKACKNQNINKERFIKLFEKFSDYSYKVILLLEAKMLDAITPVGLEWYLYTNTRIQRLYSELWLVKKEKLIFLLSPYLITNTIVKYLNEFLALTGVNLKNVKCAIHRYVKKIIYLFDVEYISHNGYVWLIKPSRQSIHEITKSIKQKLYHKNKKGYWRANNYISSSEAVLIIKKIMSSWRSYYIDVLNEREALKVNKITDYIFYKWQTK